MSTGARDMAPEFLQQLVKILKKLKLPVKCEDDDDDDDDLAAALGGMNIASTNPRDCPFCGSSTGCTLKKDGTPNKSYKCRDCGKRPV